MAFYTNVLRYKNNILHRGYHDNGERFSRKEYFQPKLFVSSKNKTEWIGLDGKSVAPVDFESMFEANQWLKENIDIAGRNIYGNKKFTQQFVTERYPRDIEFKREFINVGTFDIETDYDTGFPHPNEASQKILSISYKSSKSGLYRVWGYGDFNESKALIRPVRYYKCKDEFELLSKFLEFWSDPKHTPDVITGWNTRFFDIPYLINRMSQILGIQEIIKLSPWHMQLEHRKIVRRGNENDVYEIPGIQTLDYMELFQKFGYTYGPQESYALNHIAYVVLGEKKLSYEEEGSLKNLYKEDHQKYIDYNMKDVELVDRLEEKTGFITLAMTIAYKGGVNYQDTFGVTAIWESIVYRKLFKDNIISPIVPMRKNHFPKWEKYEPVKASRKEFNEINYNIIKLAKNKGKVPKLLEWSDYIDDIIIEGGYVKPPQVGRHKWVVSFDLNSLYPNLLVQYNMSPETLQHGNYGYKTEGAEDTINKYLNAQDKSEFINDDFIISFNGAKFTRKFVGVFPKLIKEYYDERVEVKKLQLAAQKEIQENHTVALEKQIVTLENKQLAIKILLNSLYGALANKHFLYFEKRLAESVTLSGQGAIKNAEAAMNNAMRKILGTDEQKDYIIAIDTDSLYVNFGPLVEKLSPNNPVAFLDKVCKEHFEKVLEKSYKKLFDKMQALDQRMVMAREGISSSGIWTAKKRYILNVHNNEGIQYKEPKIKIMGIEAIKSSTPEVVRNKFKKVFKLLLTGTEKETQQFIQDFRNEFKTFTPEQVSFPRRVSNISDWYDRRTIYKKSCPIHVRGSLLFNKYVKAAKIEDNYELITNGSRIKFCYLRLPNPIKENVIAFPEALPKELKLHNYINYDLQFQKTFLEPLKLILDSIGWKAEEETTLEDFFV